MKGKTVFMAKQNIDVLMALPMQLEVLVDGNVRLSLDGASGTIPFGENIHPTALKSGLLNGYSHVVGFDMFNSGPSAAWEIVPPPAGSWANPFEVDFSASSGVAWAPAVMWMSNLYEAFGRLFQMRGFIEEMSAGAATTMTAEFAGITQLGYYLAGLTLEQAANGSPARGYMDGEHSAWSIYTPNSDFGNAEVTELYYPILYLGRNIAPDSGGYGKFRAGLGHSAVWMVHNTPSGIEYQCGDAGMRSKVVANHGMYGAYPTVIDAPSYAHKTNVKELIEQQKPLIHEAGPAEKPAIATAIEAEDLVVEAKPPFVTPYALQNYDIMVHPISGAQAMGDPIERPVDLIEEDLNQEWTTERVAADINGAVFSREGNRYKVDKKATEKNREKIREDRKRRAVPFRDWWLEERRRVAAKENMDTAVVEMWRKSMELSPEWADELRAFWGLPEDFEF